MRDKLKFFCKIVKGVASKQIHLFSKYKRTDKENKTDYEYIDRTARPIYSKARSELEEMFQYYPNDKKEQFLKEFQGERSHYHYFFELFTFDLLRKKITLPDVEPTIDNQTPDFIINNNIIECTTIDPYDGTYWDIDHVIKRLSSDEYLISSYVIKDNPKQGFKKASLEHFLNNELKNAENEKEVTFKDQKGWNIEFRFTQISNKGHSRVRGSIPFKNESNPYKKIASLKETIKKKYKKYKNIDMRLNIFVNFRPGLANIYEDEGDLKEIIEYVENKDISLVLFDNVMPIHHDNVQTRVINSKTFKFLENKAQS